MKSKKSNIQRHFSKIPEVKTEEGVQSLTSFSGLIIFQKLFNSIELKTRLKACFSHLNDSGQSYPLWWTTRLLLVHLILGYRYLRDIDYYRDDPMVKRILEVTTLPDASTLSRRLKQVDKNSTNNLRKLNRESVLSRLETETSHRITIDLDGSVQSTKRHAEGSAVGFNKKKKGARSYYPLFATIAQTAQFYDLHHRSGNVHDSNGAEVFVKECLFQIQHRIPTAIIEMRMDGAFFIEQLLDTINSRGVLFTISTPFARFSGLKEIVESRQRWRKHNEFDYFELEWGADSWAHTFRVIVVRTLKKKVDKAPLQLNFFEPVDYEYDYQAIMTNQSMATKKVVEFHRGRGAQEAIFGEAKSNIQLGHIPVNGLEGNKLYAIAAMMGHNLNHELQMKTYEKQRGTTEKRSSFWAFESIRTLRQKIIQRAGRLIRPQGKLTLVVGNNEKVHTELTNFLQAA